MGIADAFGRDDRFEIKTESFIRMVQASARAEAETKYLMNAVSCEVPYRYIREMLSGISENPNDPDAVHDVIDETDPD